jgi:hypothetical protein
MGPITKKQTLEALDAIDAYLNSSRGANKDDAFEALLILLRYVRGE